jgi:hypothetical protein
LLLDLVALSASPITPIAPNATHGERHRFLAGKPTRIAGRAASEHRKRRGSCFYLRQHYCMIHDVTMTNWEYSELSFGNRTGATWMGPRGEYQKRNVSLIVWLNELAQDGWEVAGFSMATDETQFYTACLLKRAAR